MSQHLDTLRRTALILVILGLFWNLVEAVVAIWAGTQAGSVALFAFGLDSIVELLAGGILVWRLREEDGHEDEAAERRAQKLLGLTFFLLAAYVGLHSGANLLGWLPQPEPSITGVAIVIASAVVMSILYVAKMRIATQMQSWSLRAEAMETLFCDIQDLTILVGLALNALLAWWWADPVASWILIPFLINEGRENLSGHDHDHDDHHPDKPDHRTPRVCFCPNCLYGLRKCRATCCVA
ncbi:MAG: cation transporter [Chloroflexi bacterium]|nr:cation transporter [Chloroflexota bacterium]